MLINFDHVKSGRNVGSKFELTETLKGQSGTKSTVKPTELEKDCFKHIFGILIEFSV